MPPTDRQPFTRPPHRKLVVGGDTAPHAVSVSPSYDRVGGGTVITITGTNFRVSPTGVQPTVRVGGVVATSVTVVNATTITATVPAHAVGLVDIVVQAHSNQSSTLASAFTYIDTVILSVNPNHGPIAGGTLVIVTGANFPVAPTVTIGGVAAVGVIRIDSQHLTFITPAHPQGPTTIVVDTASINGAFYYTLLIRGEDLRRNPSLTVNESISANARSSFTIDGRSAPPRAGEEFVYKDDANVVLFAGIVQFVEHVYDEVPDAEHMKWNVTCSDYTPWLNRRRPVGSYSSSATHVVKDLCAKFAPWVTTNHVQTNLPVITVDFDGTDDFASVLAHICKLIGNGYYRLDYTKDLHLFRVINNSSNLGSNANPVTIVGSGDVNPVVITLAQGTQFANAYKPGYYAVRESFVYSTGVESTPGPWSSLMLMDGLHALRLTNIGLGATIGTATVVKRRIYYKLFGNDAGIIEAGFAELNDNITTVLESGPQVVTFTPQARPSITPMPAPLSAPSATQGSTSAQDAAAAIFPSIYAAGQNVGYNFDPGTWAFKLTDFADDGTESLPSPQSANVDLDGFHSVHLTTNSSGASVNGRPIQFRKIYGSRSTTKGVTPTFNPSTTILFAVIPGNGNSSFELVPVIKADNLNPDTNATTQPPGINDNGVDDNNVVGPNPELDEVPDAIVDGSVLLLHNPPMTMQEDVSQIRNRVVVYGKAVTTYPPVVMPPPSGPNANPPVTLTGTVDPYLNSVSSIGMDWFSWPKLWEYVRQHPSLKWNGSTGLPMNAHWFKVYQDFALYGVTPDSDGNRWPSDGKNHWDLYCVSQGLTHDYIEANPFTAFMDLPAGYYDTGGGGGVTTVNNPTTTSDDISDSTGVPQDPIITRERFQVDDLESQKYMGSIELDDNGKPTDGVHEVYIATDYENGADCVAYAKAELAQHAWPLVQVRYATRDPKTHPGRMVPINTSIPPVKGDFLILSVDIDQIKDEAESTDDLTPRRIVTAADPSKFNLDDLLLMIGQLSDTTNVFQDGGGGMTGMNPRDLESAALASMGYTDAQITALAGTMSSEVKAAELTLDETTMLAMSNTTPIPFVMTAPAANQQVWPICWMAEKVIMSPNNGSRVFTSAGSLQLIHNSASFLGFTLATDLNCDLTVGARSQMNGQMGTGRIFSNYSTRDPRGLKLAVCGSSAFSAPVGTGSLFVKVKVLYYILTVLNAGVTP